MRNNSEVQQQMFAFIKRWKASGLSQKSFCEKVMVISPEKNEPQNKEKTPEIQVSGLVINETGEPLPMATITNQNTGIHTLTDIKGLFNIEVAEGSMLLITYAGMKPKTVLPKSNDKLTIQLSPDILENEEVVITGYQKIDKRLSASSLKVYQGKGGKRQIYFAATKTA